MGPRFRGDDGEGTEVTYRAAAPETLRIVPLDALTLIYHRASGITHIVDTPVPEILEALSEEALSLDALLARLGERFELGDADLGALAARLDELAAAGLVEQL
jgi:PqqD family protein of HPr-rel-A system